MSKDSATVIKDGQLAVATVPQTGTLVGAASEIDATALVETADGLQLCVKTCEVGGGGGGGTVDQTYDPTSTNAQSGTAVAEAVAPALKNTATGTNSLSIGQTTGSTGSNCISIGKEATTGTYSNSVAIGNTAYVQNSAAVAVGSKARAWGVNSVAVGSYTFAYSTEAIAIGTGNMGCTANASKAIQLGEGTNTTASSFQVYTYQMLDGTTGKIPMARLPIVQLTQADYDALVSGGTVDSNTIYCIIPA